MERYKQGGWKMFIWNTSVLFMIFQNSDTKHH